MLLLLFTLKGTDAIFCNDLTQKHNKKKIAKQVDMLKSSLLWIDVDLDEKGFQCGLKKKYPSVLITRAIRKKTVYLPGR